MFRVFLGAFTAFLLCTSDLRLQTMFSVLVCGSCWPAGDLIETDVSLFQLSEAWDFNNEDMSSFCPQQQQLPWGVSQHCCHPGHTWKGTEVEKKRQVWSQEQNESPKIAKRTLY